MAWTAPRTWTAGELVTATIMNAHVRDNFSELRAGGVAMASQAADEIPYASSASQLTRSSSFKFNGTTLTIAGQIAFPAAQSASAGANTLDDYEEGTWTPVIGGSGGTSGQTYSTQVGLYVKVGQLVIAEFAMILSNKGTITTDVEIQGLPFTVHNTSSVLAPHPVIFDAMATNWIAINAAAWPNTTTARLKAITAAGAGNTAVLATADIANNTQMFGAVVYRANA